MADSYFVFGRLTFLSPPPSRSLSVFLYLERELCDLYGFWCSPTSAVAAAAAEEENETSGTCIRSSMLCDGFPDCWLDDPENSPDEVGCKVPLQPEPDSPSFTNMLNGSLIPEFTTFQWKAKVKRTGTEL
ncbi:unnamed protein product [Schistocephalus solidus]|uniref:MAM domain-containing protein n=1 Tax=Schistocephalus solidus TaxID=70667 RepID=A0A183SFD8_SCHSO|nr:unnamed protein product [Schistocephalus solidus]